MVLVRLATACALALLALGAAAPAADAARPLTPPKGLKAFLLRVNEPESLWNRTFPRTPAFAWSPVRGAKKYEFELSTSRNFSEGAIVWSSTDSGASITTPATSVPVALPWITGNPYSLYARARGVDARGRRGSWSAPYGFNMRWREKPRQAVPQYAGLVRWTPVEGATIYEVWLYGARETFFTTTNVADEREFYTFHSSQYWTGAVAWRVRAVRRLYGEIPSGLPAVTVGPWSDEFVNLNPPFATGELAMAGTVSGSTLSTPAAPQAHELTPGFLFTGNYRSWGLPWFQTTSTELFRVYVSTDSECVNRVYVGAVVGSPAYAPRFGHTLVLPPNQASLDQQRSDWPKYGDEGQVLMLDGTPVRSVDSGGLGTGDNGSGNAPKIDLWDTFWPEGGYYWTVIPVVIGPKRDNPEALEYRDIQLPEDVCRAGGAVRFGKIGKPVATGDRAPYVSGLSTAGRLVGATRANPTFYGQPIAAWEPVYGAHDYEVQYSRTLSPWRNEAKAGTTPATAAVLPVSPGRWYFRVRGLNYSLPKKPQMTWSQPVAFRVAKPRFRVIKR
ncbi:MAG TPA: hypothetical protein VE615_04555 [Gaiellaceae bacterium]|nr:hypothetical protein [Gaiellaceae bacterium]